MELKDFFDKLTSYNLFNYLFPGTIFCVIAAEISNLNLVQENLANAFFVYYLIGMIISRIGSIIIEPILKHTKFISFADYAQYVKKSKEDPLIASLSEQNNTYRTLISAFLILIILASFEKTQGEFPWLEENIKTILLVAVSILLTFSYRKQTSYIKKRVED